MPSFTSAATLPFATYLRDIDDTPLLSAQQERELVSFVREGDAEARDHLVRANLRLVVKVARAYAGRGLAMEDLIAEGNLGLVRAAEAYDPGLQTRFATYAIYWIKQSVKRAIINTARTVRVPAYASELIVKWRRAVSRLREELGRPPTEEEVAGHLGLSAKRLKIARRALRCYDSSTQRLFDEGLAEIEGAGGRPEAAITAEEDVRQALRLLGRLGERHAAVLRLRFGLAGDAPKTLKEIGEHLGLTRERVRQLEAEALDRLREQLGAA